MIVGVAMVARARHQVSRVLVRRRLCMGSVGVRRGRGRRRVHRGRVRLVGIIIRSVCRNWVDVCRMGYTEGVGSVLWSRAEVCLTNEFVADERTICWLSVSLV
jgi:hypothetical protein